MVAWQQRGLQRSRAFAGSVETVLGSGACHRSPTLPSDKGRVSERFVNRFHGPPLRRFMTEKFAALSVNHDPLAQAVSHSARTGAHEIM